MNSRNSIKTLRKTLLPSLFPTFPDPVTLEVVPGSEFALTFSQPGVDGIYEEITWYKGTRDETIALFHPDLTGDDVLYFGEFCSDDDDSCETSEKGS